MIFSMMNSLLFFTTITNLLILHFCAGILIHSVWMCTTPASAKLTSGWPRIIESIADSGEFLMPTGNSLQWLRRTLFTDKRSTYPCCYFDLSSTFGRLVPELCMIANTVLDWVFNKHGFRLTTWNQPFLTLACKRVHVLKCQSTALPNCLIENRYGPIRVHNMMQGCSKTLACCKRLKDKLTVQGGRSYISMGTQLTHFVLIYWSITE